MSCDGAVNCSLNLSLSLSLLPLTNHRYNTIENGGSEKNGSTRSVGSHRAKEVPDEGRAGSGLGLFNRRHRDQVGRHQTRLKIVALFKCRGFVKVLSLLNTFSLLAVGPFVHLPVSRLVLKFFHVYTSLSVFLNSFDKFDRAWTTGGKMERSPLPRRRFLCFGPFLGSSCLPHSRPGRIQDDSFLANESTDCFRQSLTKNPNLCVSENHCWQF